MLSKCIPVGNSSNSVASRIRSWHAPDIRGVPSRYGVSRPAVLRQWNAFGKLPPLPPVEDVLLRVDLDRGTLQVSLYSYDLFPQAMQGLFKLHTYDRDRVWDWVDEGSPILGPGRLLYLAEAYWSGYDDEVEFCKEEGIPLSQYEGLTKADITQRVREMEEYECRDLVPMPDKVQEIISVPYQAWADAPWAILAGPGSVDEQLVTSPFPDISCTEGSDVDFDNLQDLRTGVEGVIASFTKALELLNELRKLV